MKRGLSLLLAVLLAAPGCGARLASQRAHGVPRPQTAGAGSSGGAAQAITREYAEKLQVGAKVAVAVKGGESFSATYMGVEGDAVRVQKRTRIPEPPIAIPLADLTLLALDQGNGGNSVARAVLIGAATGAGFFLSLLLIAAASWD